MPKTRKLSDLYVQGREATIGADDPDGGITVWVQKLNPIEHEKAVRKANAFRARVLSDARDEDGEMFMSVLGEVQGLSRDELIETLAINDVVTRRSAIEAEIEAEDKWSKDSYLQGIQDSWRDGMSEAYAEDPGDPEALRVFTAMQEFVLQVETAVNAELKHMREEFDTLDADRLQKKAVETLIGQRIDLQWMSEFRRCQVWLSVRELENHKAYYFTSRAEVDELAQETLVQLVTEYSQLEVDALEGKGSAGTQDSSSSSEPPTLEVTETSSGPVA